MIKEIGSEFYNENITVTKDNTKNEIFVLSGRTAIDFIIKDILKKRNIKKALLPSYCCDSMVIPFIRNKIDVGFYQVDSNGIKYDENDADILLLTNYFGYINDQVSEIANREKNNKIIIYDATHTPIFDDIYYDYKFISYRKWTYCNFAKVTAKENFHVEAPKNKAKEYLSLRDEARFEKENYIVNKTLNKKSYLEKFNKAEELLDDDFEAYSGEIADIDFSNIVSIRRKNAEILIDNLKDLQEIEILHKTINRKDTPMFVPVLVKNGERDRLRKYLIGNDVYLPVHWPISEYVETNELYENELSLVIDQRYCEEDMLKEANLIKEYFSKRCQ